MLLRHQHLNAILPAQRNLKNLCSHCCWHLYFLAR